MKVRPPEIGLPKWDFKIKFKFDLSRFYQLFKKKEKTKAMTLREKQSLFIKNLGKLIIWAYDHGYELTGGELFRTHDQQLLYFEGYTLKKIDDALKLQKTASKSKTMNSDHLQKLAVDLNLFIDGEYITEGEKFRPLHEYWKSLHPDNYSGYEWGWDYNHFGQKS